MHNTKSETLSKNGKVRCFPQIIFLRPLLDTKIRQKCYKKKKSTNSSHKPQQNINKMSPAIFWNKLIILHIKRVKKKTTFSYQQIQKDHLKIHYPFLVRNFLQSRNINKEPSLNQYCVSTKKTLLLTSYLMT